MIKTGGSSLRTQVADDKPLLSVSNNHVITSAGTNTVAMIKIRVAWFVNRWKNMEAIDNKPKKKYKVIGLVFLENITPTLFPPQISDPKIIQAFKKSARERGADAILDIKISSGYKNLPDPDTIIDRRKIKRAEDKLIKFVDPG